jgi:hypothetical protein
MEDIGSERHPTPTLYNATMRAVLVLVVLVAIAAADEVTVLSHDIVLRIDPATSSFVSYDTVRVRGPGRLRVWAPADIEVSPDKLDVPEGTHEFRVRFAGHQSRHGVNLWGSVGDKPGFVQEGFYVASPRPSRFTLTIGVPPTRYAVAPGRRLDEWEADGLRYVTYAGRLAAERLTVWHGRGEVEEAKIEGVSCRIYFPPQKRKQATELLAAVRTHLPRFRELFGPLPGGRFDVVLSRYARSLDCFALGCLWDACNDTKRIDHALAHSWFGHQLRVDHARGDWSEALTTYFADYGAFERARDGVAYRARVARSFSLRVGAEADYPLRRFVETRHPHDHDVGYGKGSMVFHMLARELGRERFLEAVRHALKTYAGDTFDWDGWVTVLGEGAGRDLAPWFAPWLDRPGAPILEIGTLKAIDNVVAGTIRQTQPGAAYPLRIPVRVTTKAGREEHVVLSASKETAFSLTTKARPRRVEIDPDHHIFRKIPRDRVAPCLDAVLTAEKRVGYGDAEKLQRFGVELAVGEPPADAALLAIGLPLEIKKTLLSGARQQDPSLAIETGRFEIRGKGYDQPGDGLLFSSHVPGLPPFTFFHGNAAAAYGHPIELKDYGLDSWVVFRDGQPVARGTYPHTDRAVRAEITPARTGGVAARWARWRRSGSPTSCAAGCTTRD